MQVTLKGRPCQTNGTLPKVGTKAKDFTLVDKSLNEKSLNDWTDDDWDFYDDYCDRKYDDEDDILFY